MEAVDMDITIITGATRSTLLITADREIPGIRKRSTVGIRGCTNPQGYGEGAEEEREKEGNEERKEGGRVRKGRWKRRETERQAPRVQREWEG